MNKNSLIKYCWPVFFTISVLSDALASPMIECLQDCGDNSLKPALFIKAADKKKNISNKKLQIFLNETNFQTYYDNKLLNDPFNKIKKPSSSFLYEFNVTNDKSEINNMVFHFLPWFDKKSLEDNHNQTSKPYMVTLFQIDLF